MAYAQATITNANPAVILQAQLDSMFLAEGWTVEDSFTPSGDYRAKVYKSSGATNQCGYDWFVALMWDTTGSESYFTALAGSTYNGVTKVLGRAAYTGAAQTQTYSSVSSSITNAAFSNPVIGATSWYTSNSQGTPQFASPVCGRVILPSAAFGYWASITKDHFTLLYAGAVSATVTYFTLDVSPGYAGSFNGAPGTPIAGFGGVTTSDEGMTLNERFLGSNQSGVDEWVFLPSRGQQLRSSTLPALTGPNDLVATAYRPRIHVIHKTTSNTAAQTWSVTPDNQRLGSRSAVYVYTDAPKSAIEPVFVGQGIDVWQVNGGSVGDTITISGEEWLVTRANGLAVKVEA